MEIRWQCPSYSLSRTRTVTYSCPFWWMRLPLVVGFEFGLFAFSRYEVEEGRLFGWEYIHISESRQGAKTHILTRHGRPHIVRRWRWRYIWCPGTVILIAASAFSIFTSLVYNSTVLVMRSCRRSAQNHWPRVCMPVPRRRDHSLTVFIRGLALFSLARAEWIHIIFVVSLKKVTSYSPITPRRRTRHCVLRLRATRGTIRKIKVSTLGHRRRRCCRVVTSW